MDELRKTGRVTIPTDLDVVPETLEILKKWGADAIRDCDGTDFPQQLKDADAKIYSVGGRVSVYRSARAAGAVELRRRQCDRTGRTVP